MPHGSSVGHSIEDHHPGYRLALFLRLRRIHTMGLDIDGETMHSRFDREILQLAEVVGIIFLKHGDGAACAGDIDAPKPWIELYHVRTLRHRQMGDRLMRIEIEDGEDVVALAGKK